SAGSLGSNTSFHEATAKPQQNTTMPPKIKNPSPPKVEFYRKLPIKTQTFESLAQMGFRSANIHPILFLFQSDQEIIDYLTILQDCSLRYCTMVLAFQDPAKIKQALRDATDLVEMGFSLADVSATLAAVDLDKNKALEQLLKT
ncbi:hypothetical protein HDU91_004045, partial [Kappamyces sp. JEL0680]